VSLIPTVNPSAFPTSPKLFPAFTASEKSVQNKTNVSGFSSGTKTGIAVASLAAALTAALLVSFRRRSRVMLPKSLGSLAEISECSG